jgi:hypothetical protein
MSRYNDKKYQAELHNAFFEYLVSKKIEYNIRLYTGRVVFDYMKELFNEKYKEIKELKKEIEILKGK